MTAEGFRVCFVHFVFCLFAVIGSCNGLQHYAALGLDAKGGAQVNLVPSDKPQDVYTGVCDIVKKKVGRLLRPSRSPDVTSRRNRCLRPFASAFDPVLRDSSPRARAS